MTWSKQQKSHPRVNKLFKRGFTLVEMMVAIAILAISAMIIYSSNSNAIRHQLQLEEATIGHWLLLNAIEEEKLRRIVQPETAGDDLKESEIKIGENTYRITREPQETDSDLVEVIEFSIEFVDHDYGDHLIDHITTVMQKIE